MISNQMIFHYWQGYNVNWNCPFHSGDGNACYRYSPLQPFSNKIKYNNDKRKKTGNNRGIDTKFSGIGKFKPIKVKGLPRQLHCKFTVVVPKQELHALQSPPDSEYDSEACPLRGLRKLKGRCPRPPVVSVFWFFKNQNKSSYCHLIMML